MAAARLGTSLQALGGIDWTGSALLASTVVCLILPVTLGGNYWHWASAQVPILLVVSLVSLLGLMANEFSIEQDKALLPVRMMKNGRLLAALANLFLYSVCFDSFLYYM